MQLSKGTLLLVKSKRPPVFGLSPIEVAYMRAPKKGQAFLFTRPDRGPWDRCNTSTIQKITRIDGFQVLKTLNSTYIFMKAKNEVPNL